MLLLLRRRWRRGRSCENVYFPTLYKCVIEEREGGIGEVDDCDTGARLFSFSFLLFFFLLSPRKGSSWIQLVCMNEFARNSGSHGL